MSGVAEVVEEAPKDGVGTAPSCADEAAPSGNAREICRETCSECFVSRVDGVGSPHPEKVGRTIALALLVYFACGLAWVFGGSDALAAVFPDGGAGGKGEVMLMLLASVPFAAWLAGYRSRMAMRHLGSHGQRQRLVSAVFASMREGVVVTDLEGRVRVVNSAFRSISGYAEEELLGHKLSMLKSGRHPSAFYREMWSSLARDGFWQGEIWNRRKNGDLYAIWLTISTVPDASGAPYSYVGVLLDVSPLKQSERQLDYLAHHDVLTGLANRLMLLTRLQKVLRQSRQPEQGGALLFIDLDRFKHVNDSLGHPAGDELLCQVAVRFGECLRETDLLARFGGDEFVVLLEGVASANGAATVAEKLLQGLARSFLVCGGNEVIVGASIGIALYPRDGDSPDALIQHADSALYNAKSCGSNAYRFYAEAQTRAADERLAMEVALRRALDHDEFVLYYQPQVDARDGSLIGVEALVRWRSSQRGLVSPSRFIPLAEESGFIVALGDWVLRDACAQARAWLDEGVPLTRLAVNLSARQFRQPDLVERIRAMLDGNGLRPTLLELEITESVLMDVAGAMEKLGQLASIGVRIAIDDFGTGYSSFAYLKSIPFDVIKIDKSFVGDIGRDQASSRIVATIIQLGHGLDREVVAEGVETAEQRDFLLAAGCSSCQGYLFSPPFPARELDAWLRGEPY